MNTHDDELRTRFQTLRAEREEQAGSFRAPHASGRMRRRHPLLLATAAALPALIGVTIYSVYFSQAAHERRVVRDIAELITWRSPTDTLLYNAYADWLSVTPSLLTNIPASGVNP